MAIAKFGLSFIVLYNAFVIGNCDLVSNINDAIVHNLKNEYSTDTRQLETSGIKAFVGEILQTCNTRDSHVISLRGLLDDVTNATLSDVSIQNCQAASFNITACRLAITEYCVGADDIIELVSADDLKLDDIFPALLYSITNPNCEHDRDELYQKSHVHEKTPSWKAWLYGGLFCVALCLISNIGAFLAPCMKTSYFQRFLLFCVGIAVGTMAATGFLILLPESMGLTVEDSPVPDYSSKLSCALGAIYFFFVSEKFMKKVFQRRKEKKNKDKDIEIEIGMETKELMNTKDTNLSEEQQNGVLDDKESKEKDGHGHDHDKKHTIATVAYVLMTGDSLHKFVDGVSVGAAFTENVYVGFSVALAIVCEELPHELGDIAILLQSGVPMKKALLVNTLAGAVSFFGVVVGILLGENTNANMWIFAVAGGMFIYIALVDMVPAMDTQFEIVVGDVKERELPAFLIQHIGLIMGYVIMLLVTIYSGDINI